MKTLANLYDNILGLRAKYGECIMDMPLIYAKDDEGNGYQKVDNDLTTMKTKELKEYFIEEVSSEKELKKINCICIN